MRDLKIILFFVILTLLSSACNNNKIERSQQEIRQEKVERAKKKVTSTLNKSQMDSSEDVSKEEYSQIGDSMATKESDVLYDDGLYQENVHNDYAPLIENGAWLNEEQISNDVRKHIDQQHKVSVVLSMHGKTTSIICTTCNDELLDEWQNPVDDYDTRNIKQGKIVEQGVEVNLPATQMPTSVRKCLEKGHTIYTTVDTTYGNRHFECSYCGMGADCPMGDIGTMRR